MTCHALPYGIQNKSNSTTNDCNAGRRYYPVTYDHIHCNG